MKYRRLQLKRMAKHLLVIKERGSNDYIRFTFAVSLRTNDTMLDIDNKIERYAMGDIS